MFIFFSIETFKTLTYRTFGQSYLAGPPAFLILCLRNPWWLVVSCIPHESKTLSMAIVNRISGA